MSTSGDVMAGPVSSKGSSLTHRESLSPERLAFSAFCGKPKVRSNRRGVSARAGRVGVVLEDCAVLAGKACRTDV